MRTQKCAFAPSRECGYSGWRLSHSPATVASEDPFMKVQTVRRMAAGVVLLVLAFACPPAARGADDAQADAAREVFKKHQDAVVWVSAVMKMRGGGPLAAAMGQQEQKVDAVGTIIHESGLTVVSHTNIDPTALMNSVYSEMKIPGQDTKIEFKSELSGVKIRLADGTEI